MSITSQYVQDIMSHRTRGFLAGVDLSAQDRLPVVEALKNYQHTIRFHMPGHRGGAGADPIAIDTLGEKAYTCDVTGVHDLDDLHEPRGALKEAQELAAKAFGAEVTYFMVNGTSSAVQTMILSVMNDGDVLVIPRNIHKSILSGIILSGARPAFILPNYDDYYGFAMGVDEAAVNRFFETDPNARDAKAVLLVNPTYYGTSVDLTRIAEKVHSEGKILMVDEAHGPHFRFHPALPKTALESGVDAAAQGAHKMIGALTQASLLHIQGQRYDRARLKAFFQFLSSTSPSYLLMASLDLARRQMVLFGKELLDYAIDLAQTLRREVNRIPGLHSFGEEITANPGADFLDPTKVTITVRELGITGYQAERYLKLNHGIQVELSDLYNILCIVSYGNTPRDIWMLLEGLKSLVDAVARGELKKELMNAQTIIPELPPIPKMAMVPRKAVESPWERVHLKEALGRVSAEVVTCYPPGIPILYPGEVISYETIGYLDVIKRLAFGISGPEDRTLTTLRVVKEM